MCFLLSFFTLFGYHQCKGVDKEQQEQPLPMFKKIKSDKTVQRKAAAKSYINAIQKQIIRNHTIKAMPILWNLQARDE